MWYLEEVSETKKRYGPITADSFIIGRNPNANIILKNLQVSRRHCILTLRDDSIHLQDLGSANGIYINETKVDSNTERILSVNDLLGIGSTVTQTENDCVFKLLRIDKSAEKVTENKNISSMNEKRPATWDSCHEKSSKKYKTTSCEQNQIIKGSNELPIISISHQDKIETSGIKIELETDDSIDMFSQNPIDSENKTINENLTVSLLDSDEEDDVCLNTSYVLPKNNLVDHDLIIISSDEEDDNPWLEKLSQRSGHSPPPKIENWYSSERELNQWWPILSQNILDEFEKEDQEANHLIDAKIQVQIQHDKCSNISDDMCKLKANEIDIKDVNQIDKSKDALNSIVSNLRKERPSKYIKPPIIEAPHVIKSIKEPKHTGMKPSSAEIEKKNKHNKNDKKQRLKNDSSIKNVKIKTSPQKINKKNNDNREQRKKRLKEIVDAKSKKDEKLLTKDKEKKIEPKLHIKVKCTTTNRSDLFTADILKKVNKPSTRISKSNINSSTLKNNVIRKNDMKCNEKLFTLNIDVDRKNENVEPNKKLPLLQNKDISQNIINKSNNSSISSKIHKKLKKNTLKKKVTFDLTPRIKIFTRDHYENSILYLMFRERRPLINISMNDCYYKEDIIYEIVNWEPKSLLTTNIPMNLIKDVKQNNITYDSFQQYYHIFKNLMMLELWSAIQQSYNMNDVLKKVFQADIKNFHVCTEQMQKDRKMYTLDCQLLLTKEDDQQMIHPKIGEAIIIKLTTENANGIQESSNRFGYIVFTRKHSLNQARDEFPLQLLASVNNPEVLMNFTVLTRWDSNTLKTDNCIHIRRLGRITSFMKEFTALQKLPQSPLMPLILNPSRLNNINNYYRVENLNNNLLNTNQKEIIFQVTGSCLSTEPSINLIRGPPGTGKSYLIVNLVIHLLYGNNRYNECIDNRDNLPRILICAPTNSAIDDIVIKLLDYRKKIESPSKKFRMVRVGLRNKIHPYVQCVSAQALYEYNANINMFKRSTRFEGANRKRNLEINSRETNNTKTDAYSQNSNKIIDEDLIIKKADIICTTLGSSISVQLERLAKDRSFRFTTCIIDEATQCTEPTALLPLMFGIDSLVLVGDVQQLPAFIKCQEAKKYGLGQSLFGRIEKCFSKNHKCPHIRSLSVQYRMHPEIMEFPNKYFYNNQLVNNQNVYKYKFPLIPYQLFLHDFEQCSSMNNSKEAEFILNIVKAIFCQINFKVTIGIITPYQNQRMNIMKILESINRKEDIVVNTVDGFQGQEKDIIILSCVRTEGFGFLADDQRLNVALTRAKYSFYIVGNFQALQVIPTWNALKNDAEYRKKIFFTKNIMISEEVLSKVLKNK